MRIFISIALIIVLSVKVRANDDIFATPLIDPSVLDKLSTRKQSLTAAALSRGIPNAEAFQLFFQRFSDNFIEACRTLEIAQFFVSAVQPYTIEKHFDKIIDEFDQHYPEHPEREIMKQKVKATRLKLRGYASELASFIFVPFFSGVEHSTYINIHRQNFGNVEIAKQLDDYLKHVNCLIGYIQNSISESRGKIQHDELKRLGLMISKGAVNFVNLVGKVDDVSSLLTKIDNAIDGLRNANGGTFFNDMKTNARNIQRDLHQLEVLMEKQWTDMNCIFFNQASQITLPTVQLVNKLQRVKRHRNSGN